MTQEEIKKIIADHPDATVYSLIAHWGDTQPYHCMGLRLLKGAEALECCERIKRFKCGFISEFALESHYWEEDYKSVEIPQDQKALIFTGTWIKEDQL